MPSLHTIDMPHTVQFGGAFWQYCLLRVVPRGPCWLSKQVAVLSRLRCLRTRSREPVWPTSTVRPLLTPHTTRAEPKAARFVTHTAPSRLEGSSLDTRVHTHCYTSLCTHIHTATPVWTHTRTHVYTSLDTHTYTRLHNLDTHIQ